jgi:hypothetical protein
MTWSIKILRVLVLLVLIGGLFWVSSLFYNLGGFSGQVFLFGPNLQFLSTLFVILILMPVFVLYCSSNTFITKWWNNKGRLILLICYLLIAFGYFVSLYGALIIAAS